MRIISGIHRSRQITAPKNLPVRPTTDFAKSGLFNILASRYNFKRLEVADLFSGTGSLTYEFLSRGCEKVIAVDKNPGCIRFIQQTLVLLKAGSGIQAIQSDALNWLARTSGTYDIIIADAPFAETPAESLINAVADRKLLKKKGLLIIEHANSNDLSTLPYYEETRKYGNVAFSFFRIENDAKTD